MREADTADTDPFLKPSEKSDQDVRTAYEQASELRRKGLSQEALTLLEGILHRDPDHTAARYALVVCLTDLGRAADAVSHLRRVLAAVPEHHEAAYRLGRILQAAGDRAGAADAYRRVLEFAEFSDARARLRQCEQAPSGTAPGGFTDLGHTFPSGEEVPLSLRARVDSRHAADRGELKDVLRLQARHLAPAMLGKALMAVVAAVLLVAALAGDLPGVPLFVVAAILFGAPRVAGVAALLVAVGGIVTGYLRPPVQIFDNVGDALALPSPDTLLSVCGTTFVLIIVIIGIPGALLNSWINGSDVYEYGVEIKRGLIRRTVQFIWYYQIVESPSYLRTLSSYFTHTASLGIRYNDNGASSVTRIEMSGVGTPALVKKVGRYLESRIPSERLPIRGPWT
ncbi:tetratricopeptide repeat protein [Streptosporangium sp. NPDC002721]|uniref:tetratricopeptide repeat protein n=1 Tax=Streptosporangium sp. NPDC002721 TaxID=3366188 RepID=UPI00369A2BA7